MMTGTSPGVLAAILLAAPAAAIVASSPVPCRDGGPPVAVALAELWAESTHAEAGYLAAADAVAAENALRSAVRREWVPRFSLDGLGNWGQRLSPSEERVLGAGPRGELRLVGAWTLLDGGRHARSLEADLRATEAHIRGGAFDVAFRADVARLYVEAAHAEALWRVREEQRAMLESLALPVRLRVEAGVDVAWEGQLLDETIARAERRLSEADRSRAGYRAEISMLAGRCAFAAPIAPAAGRPDHLEGDDPGVRLLLGQAEVHDALAEVETGRNAWELLLLGSAGPTRSRAFTPGPVRTEYLFGLGAAWTPDLTGRRRQLAEAEYARARSLRAEAESRRAAVEREKERIAAELEHTAMLQASVEQELAETRKGLDIAVARWEAGVDSWTEVVRAYERVEQTRTLQIDLARETALATIRYGEAAGDLTHVPHRLGQEG